MAVLAKLDTVKVRDLKGKVHLMKRANATDMVQHNGWQIVFETPPVPGAAVLGLELTAEQAAHAQAPRQLRQRDENILAGRVASQQQQGTAHLANPLAEAMQQARLERVEQDEEEDEEVDKPDPKPGRKPRRQSEPKDTDGEEALAAVMPAVKAHAIKTASKDELADLEGDESAREPKDE